jgi:2-iminobutanoate/2-iminopropanoate deaminase
MKAGSKRCAVLLTSALLAGGCSFGGGGRGWVAQGPGDIPEAKEAPARRPAPVAAAAPVEQPRAPAGATRQGSATPLTDPAPNSGAYTQATRYGDLLFISGQIGMDARTNQMVGDKVEDQTRQAMENIRLVLEAHRLTMANVVSVTVYVKDLAHFRAMDDAYETFFRSALPARSVVEVSRLPRGALVEISVIAGR